MSASAEATAAAVDRLCGRLPYCVQRPQVGPLVAAALLEVLSQPQLVQLLEPQAAPSEAAGRGGLGTEDGAARRAQPARAPQGDRWAPSNNSFKELRRRTHWATPVAATLGTHVT